MTSKPVYVIKGKVTEYGDHIKVPHTPTFESVEDARAFYESNENYQVYYKWDSFYSLAVFEMPPRPVDVFVESIIEPFPESVVHKEQ